MTHRKKSGSIEEAIDVIVSRLGGSENTARMLGASRSTVDSWKNPGRSVYPSVEQVIALDAAYANNTGNSHPTPIIAALLLSVEKQRRHPFSVNLVDEVLNGRLMMEEIASSLLAHVRDGKLGQPARLATDQSEKLNKTINDAVRCLIRLSQAIDEAGRIDEEKNGTVRYSAAPLPPGYRR
jgi:hypothetical protein